MADELAGVVEHGCAMAGDPVIGAVGVAQAELQGHGFAGIDMATERAGAAVPVIRMNVFQPAAAHLLGQRAAREAQPGPVEPVALTVEAGAPSEVREALQHAQVVIAGEDQLAIADAQGVEQFAEGPGQFAEFVGAGNRNRDVGLAGGTAVKGIADAIHRTQYVTGQHQVGAQGDGTEDGPQADGQVQHGIAGGAPQAGGIEAQGQHAVFEAAVLAVGAHQQDRFEDHQAAPLGVEHPFALALQDHPGDLCREGPVGQFVHAQVVEPVVGGSDDPCRASAQEGDAAHVAPGAQSGHEAAQVGRFAGSFGGGIYGGDEGVGALLHEAAKAVEEVDVEHRHQQRETHRPDADQRSDQAPAQGQGARAAHARAPRAASSSRAMRKSLSVWRSRSWASSIIAPCRWISERSTGPPGSSRRA